MVKAFVDSDVILDFLLEREPFATDTATLFSLAELKKINLYTSPVIISNCYYILRKFSTHQFVIRQLLKLLEIVDVIDMNRSVVMSALTSGFKDFEDALQNFAALNAKLEIIITRNISDYAKSEVIVYKPAEFLLFFKSLK